MPERNEELEKIVTRFAESGWDVIDSPSRAWLAAPNDGVVEGALKVAVREADVLCGSCGCEFDPLYKRVLALLQA